MSHYCMIMAFQYHGLVHVAYVQIKRLASAGSDDYMRMTNNVMVSLFSKSVRLLYSFDRRKGKKL